MISSPTSTTSQHLFEEKTASFSVDSTVSEQGILTTEDGVIRSVTPTQCVEQTIVNLRWEGDVLIAEPISPLLSGSPKNFDTSNKQHSCTTCNKTFSKSSNLKAHQRIHSGERPYKCTTCDKAFSQVSSLKAHQLTHTGERPHRCTICHKTFTQISSLKAHQLTHTGERPHRCTICHKTFTQLSSLQVHQRNHTGEKPYKCQLGGCGKRFAQVGHLKKHQRTHTR